MNIPQKKLYRVQFCPKLGLDEGITFWDLTNKSSSKTTYTFQILRIGLNPGQNTSTLIDELCFKHWFWSPSCSFELVH